MEPVPPPVNPTQQRDQDDLERLVLFHKIFAGFLAAGSCCGVPHFTIGLLTMTGNIASPKSGRPEDPLLFGPLFAAAGLVLIMGALAMSFFNFRMSKWIAGREKLTPLYIVSAINLLLQPVGLALSIYTLVVLSRPTVKSQFDLNS